MFSRINKSKIKITIIACNVILLAVVGLSVGYSAFNIELGIRNIYIRTMLILIFQQKFPKIIQIFFSLTYN